MGEMARNPFPTLDAAGAPRRRSRHLLRPVLGMTCREAPAPQGLRPWGSPEVLAPFQDFSWPDLTSSSGYFCI